MLPRFIALSLIPLSASAAAFEGMPAASAEELDRMRAGFTLQLGGQSLEVAFGIERAIFVNGEPVSSTRLNLPVSALQTGAGNSFSMPAQQATSPAVMNVLQNSLDNQLIRQMTVIHARVQALDALRVQRFNEAFQTRLLNSAR